MSAEKNNEEEACKSNSQSPIEIHTIFPSKSPTYMNNVKNTEGVIEDSYTNKQLLRSILVCSNVPCEHTPTGERGKTTNKANCIHTKPLSTTEQIIQKPSSSTVPIQHYTSSGEKKSCVHQKLQQKDPEEHHQIKKIDNKENTRKIPLDKANPPDSKITDGTAPLISTTNHRLPRLSTSNETNEIAFLSREDCECEDDDHFDSLRQHDQYEDEEREYIRKDCTCECKSHRYKTSGKPKWRDLSPEKDYKRQNKVPLKSSKVQEDLRLNEENGRVENGHQNREERERCCEGHKEHQNRDENLRRYESHKEHQNRDEKLRRYEGHKEHRNREEKLRRYEDPKGHRNREENPRGYEERKSRHDGKRSPKEVRHYKNKHHYKKINKRREPSSEESIHDAPSNYGNERKKSSRNYFDSNQSGYVSDDNESYSSYCESSVDSEELLETPEKICKKKKHVVSGYVKRYEEDRAKKENTTSHIRHEKLRPTKPPIKPHVTTKRPIAKTSTKKTKAPTLKQNVERPLKSNKHDILPNTPRAHRISKKIVKRKVCTRCCCRSPRSYDSDSDSVDATASSNSYSSYEGRDGSDYSDSDSLSPEGRKNYRHKYERKHGRGKSDRRNECCTLETCEYEYWSSPADDTNESIIYSTNENPDLYNLETDDKNTGVMINAPEKQLFNNGHPVLENDLQQMSRKQDGKKRDKVKTNKASINWRKEPIIPIRQTLTSYLRTKQRPVTYYTQPSP